jgi:inward rectifier potassium channel
MSWLKFLGLIVLFYVIINTFFALIYLLAGIENLQGFQGTNLTGYFWDAFFFSTQTFTTVGYGTISPVGFATNIIASTETMLGWLAFALAAGLLYGRFSRPMAKILFSKHALISPYQDKTSFQFRVANARSNQLIEVEVQVIFTTIETLPDGQKIRQFHQLELERKKVDLLVLSWTVVHPIDRNSPIYGWSKQKMDKSDAEFLVLIKGFDDTFSQTVHTRASYRYNEIYWGGKYNSMYDNEIKGITTLYMDRLDSVERVEMKSS